MRILFITLLATLSLTATAQDINDKMRAALQAQEELDSSYADKEESPLTEEDFEHFDGLPFFPIDTNWMVHAKLVLTPEAEPFEMATSTNRKPLYRQYAEVHIPYGDTLLVLHVYQNLELSKRPGYEDYLFLPFGDSTNGSSTYGGGRYLDFTIPEDDTLFIDFNQCYNPLCAYNGRYSCPRIPLENILDVSIKAGVKAPPHH